MTVEQSLVYTSINKTKWEEINAHSL